MFKVVQNVKFGNLCEFISCEMYYSINRNREPLFIIAWFYINTKWTKDALNTTADGTK